jgi:hypothetical protein
MRIGGTGVTLWTAEGFAKVLSISEVMFDEGVS